MGNVGRIRAWPLAVFWKDRELSVLCVRVSNVKVFQFNRPSSLVGFSRRRSRRTSHAVARHFRDRCSRKRKGVQVWRHVVTTPLSWAWPDSVKTHEQTMSRRGERELTTTTPFVGLFYFQSETQDEETSPIEKRKKKSKEKRRSLILDRRLWVARGAFHNRNWRETWNLGCRGRRLCWTKMGFNFIAVDTTRRRTGSLSLFIVCVTNMWMRLPVFIQLTHTFV